MGSERHVTGRGQLPQEIPQQDRGLFLKRYPWINFLWRERERRIISWTESGGIKCMTTHTPLPISKRNIECKLPSQGELGDHKENFRPLLCTPVYYTFVGQSSSHCTLRPGELPPMRAGLSIQLPSFHPRERTPWWLQWDDMRERASVHRTHPSHILCLQIPKHPMDMEECLMDYLENSPPPCPAFQVISKKIRGVTIMSMKELKLQKKISSAEGYDLLLSQPTGMEQFLACVVKSQAGTVLALPKTTHEKRETILISLPPGRGGGRQ